MFLKDDDDDVDDADDDDDDYYYYDYYYYYLMMINNDSGDPCFDNIVSTTLSGPERSSQSFQQRGGAHLNRSSGASGSLASSSPGDP